MAEKTGSKSNIRSSTGNLLGSKLSSSKAALLKSPRGSVHASKQALAPPAADNAAAARAIVYENTYRLKPTKKFPTLQAKEIAVSVLKKHLEGQKYDYGSTPQLTQAIANDLLQESKKLECDRYKIVIDVNVGEFKGQGIKVASRAVWDTTTDTYASASFRNGSIFGVAMIFACYYE